MSNQIEQVLEDLTFHDGVARFHKDYEAKLSLGLLTSAHLNIFNRALLNCISSIKGLQEAGSKGGPVQQWREDIVQLAPEAIAYMGLSVVFHRAVASKTTAAIYGDIGEDIYYTLKRKDTDRNLVCTMGAQVYHHIITCGIFEEYQDAEGAVYVTFTDEAAQEIQTTKDWQQFMKPFWRPMVSKPRSVIEGSYLDSRLSERLTLVRTFSKLQKSLIEPLRKPETPFIKACDAIQAVALKINDWMLPIIQECYNRNLQIGGIPTCNQPKGTTADKRRLRSQLKSLQAGFRNDLEEANHYKNYDEVYLPVTMDFRGRIYAKPYLNHQRADYIKSMWLFAEGKPMDTPEAVRWLKIHIANCGDFGKVSKASFADREKWVNDNIGRIYDTVEAPFADLWWTVADAPFSFLAACRELVEFIDMGADYVCHLPIAVDGSCSGLQHFSAMLRDEVGGKSVNLIPAAKPEDVYKDVAGIVNQLVLQEQDDPLAQEWLAHKIDRKVTKRATMTLCYGSKQYGWREQLMEDFMNKYTSSVAIGAIEKHPFEAPGKASGYMAKKLDTALRMTVKKALEGMEWLQDVAALLAKENKPLIWHTPMQFPVVNEYLTPIEKRLDITINKRRVRTKLVLGFKDTLKVTKQRSTVSPNFVHSYDACHLMMTVLAAREEGLNNFLLIHDSFGCLPSDMERFSKIVKEQFYALYSQNDPFTNIYMYAISTLSERGKKKLTPPPEKGILDLKMILQSDYAFA